jgi:hypothetical protein
MSITTELDELIALHGNCRDALNVTLAKLRQVQNENTVLKEAAQQSVQADSPVPPPPELCLHGYRYMCPHGCQDESASR